MAGKYQPTQSSIEAANICCGALWGLVEDDRTSQDLQSAEIALASPSSYFLESLFRHSVVALPYSDRWPLWYCCICLIDSRLGCLISRENNFYLSLVPFYKEIVSFCVREMGSSNAPINCLDSFQAPRSVAISHLLLFGNLRTSTMATTFWRSQSYPEDSINSRKWFVESGVFIRGFSDRLGIGWRELFTAENISLVRKSSFELGSLGLQIISRSSRLIGVISSLIPLRTITQTPSCHKKAVLLRIVRDDIR